MTLIEARKADGTLIGRCDAKCYCAHEYKCTCICGGKNHGRGLRQAYENAPKIARDITGEYDEVKLVEINPDTLALELMKDDDPWSGLPLFRKEK